MRNELKDVSNIEGVAYTGIVAAMEMAYKTAVDAGWYNDPITGVLKKRNFGEVIALMHSELSEALEADRKGLKDGKLSDLDGRAVEFADCIIRIFDTARALNLPLAEAFIHKNRYNQQRADHKPENRKQKGGKKY